VFAGVGGEVEEHRELRLEDWLVDPLAVTKPPLDVLPLDRHQRSVRPEEQHGLAAGGLALAEQKRRSVDAVDWPVGWHLVRCPGEGRERLVPVVCRERLLGNDAGRDFPRPADDRRDPHRALGGRSEERARGTGFVGAVAVPHHSSKPWSVGSRPSVSPQCHLPHSEVAYPASESRFAIVYSHGVRPLLPWPGTTVYVPLPTD
jgi:hypothetical protein